MVKLWFTYITAQLLGLKFALIKSIMGYLPSDQVSLVAGMVFGDTDNLSANISRDLKVTGMQHVASASGTNVGLILQPVIHFSRHFKVFKWLRYLVEIVVLASYVVMTRGNAPIIRAVLMAVYKMACEHHQRQYQPGYALGLAAFSMILFKPAYLGELSFQLSMGASVGIIYILPFLRKIPQVNLVAKLDFLAAEQESLPVTNLTNLVMDAFYCTLAAQLTVIPILLLHDLPISLVSLIANPLLLWCVPLITLVGLATLILAVIFQSGCWWLWLVLKSLLLAVGLLVNLFITGLSFWGQWEIGLITLPNSWLVAGAWWCGLAVWWQWQQKQLRTKRS